MFDRLQTRLVLLFAILFVLVQGMISFAVYRATTTNINAQVSEQLLHSESLVQQGLANDVSQLADGTRLLASDFGFRQAVATRDDPTMRSALDNLVSRIEADSAILISLDEEIIADTAYDAEQQGMSFGFPDLIEKADIDGQATTFINERGKLYEMVLMPVLAPIPIAWIGVRLEMDDAKAQRFKEILLPGIDISFILRNESSSAELTSGQWQLIASTLPDNSRTELSDKIDKGDAINGIIKLGNQDFMALPVEFLTGIQNANVNAILQYSLDVAYNPYQTLIISLSVLIVLGLASLVLGSVFISRSVTRPISALAESAQRISEGNYSPVSQSGRKDEVHQLASSFNTMIEGISQREAKIIYQAEHDLATGLPNRIGFGKHVNSMIFAYLENGEVFSVLEVSVDRFRDIRNALGFSFSESLIKEVGPKLNALAPESDCLARTGSSIFLMALPRVDLETAEEICRRIVQGFEKPIVIRDATIDVQVNIGIVSYPEHGNSAEDVLQLANIACFQSEGLISHIAVYDELKDQHDTDKLSLMSELRRALEQDKGEITFHYQPKIDLNHGAITHAEALIRWNHPQQGLISPEIFIPLAEKTGHIHHLTRWVLENGIQQAGQWQQQGLAIKLAINLSAKDLANKELPGLIIDVLKTHSARVDCLVLEVTESAVMEDPELALGVLNELDEMGLTLSIDDYGTGYSSMAYLKRLPVKEIKIDKSFVEHLAMDTDDEIIVRSTIELGHNLGLKVTGEGVEDKVALDILRGLGCDTVQGYYFAKPMPVDEFNEFVQTFSYDFEKNKTE